MPQVNDDGMRRRAPPVRSGLEGNDVGSGRIPVLPDGDRAFDVTPACRNAALTSSVCRATKPALRCRSTACRSPALAPGGIRGPYARRGGDLPRSPDLVTLYQSRSPAAPVPGLFMSLDVPPDLLWTWITAGRHDLNVVCRRSLIVYR